MPESVLCELKRYIDFGAADEAALRMLLPIARPHFPALGDVFYARVREHEGARAVLEEGPAQVERLKCRLIEWLERMLSGPWDDEYFQLRCRIGRIHVRIGLEQHYMFGAMNVVRRGLDALIDAHFLHSPEALRAVRAAVARVLDLELAIMLHSYREDLVEQQARAARLSTFGQLVGSIGHELRNPLGVIESSLYVLQQRAPDDPRVRQHLDRIAEQVQLASGIVGSMLDLIHDRPLVRSQVQVGALVRSAAQAVLRPNEVRLTVDGLDDARVDGDATQLRQAFLNLIENAVQAVGKSGEVRVIGQVGPLSAIAFEDSGPGVDPVILPRLFEPLATSKPTGNGLGLALVKRIVERHGGAIHYEAREGGGARFVVQLPRQVSA